MSASPSTICKHSVAIAGHRTSVSLEAEFWDALTRIAASRGQSVQSLIAEIDQGRQGRNLSSAIRVHVLSSIEGTRDKSHEKSPYATHQEVRKHCLSK